MDENRADVGHESDDEVTEIYVDDDVCSIGTCDETKLKGGNGLCEMNKQEHAHGHVPVFEHGLASASTKTCEAGVEGAHLVHFTADENGLKHKLSEASTKSCEAGPDVAPPVLRRSEAFFGDQNEDV